MPTYYEILGCDKNASYEEIKKCYHDQVKKCHPDKAKEESQREFLDLDKAWKTLRNADSRRQYDMEMAKNEVEGTPLYSEVDVCDMTHDPETETYSYECRCGGLYTLNKGDMIGVERLKVPCDECTFHIEILLNKSL